MPASLVHLTESPVVAGSSRRILVASMPGSGGAWVAGAAALLLEQLHGGRDVWSGWAPQLPSAVFPAGDAVVCINDPEEALVAAADHVFFVPRDLRDAVVAHHRAFGLPANLQTAQRAMHHALQWERCASFVLTQESILADPAGALQRVADHLGITRTAPDAMLLELQNRIAALNRAAGVKHVARCAYVTALRPEVVGQIEAHFGSWLHQHGYACTTCSSVWAAATDKTAAREAVWAKSRQLADEIRAVSCAAESTVQRRDLVTRTLDFCSQFGAPAFQTSAAELVAALSGPSPVVDWAQGELLFQQRKFAPALALARRACARVGDEEIAALLERCSVAAEANRANGSPPGVEVPSMVSGKTAREPLPPVSPAASQTQDSIRRLAEHVRGRVVAFLLHGSSIAEFAGHAPALAAQDVVWASLNHFGLVEERFLRPVGRELSLVFCCADGEVQRRIQVLESFLRRPSSQLLITRPDHLATFAAQLEPHRSKIAVEKLPPVWPYPNSLTLFLRLLVQAGPRRIVLFGCDGYLGDDDVSLPTYIGAEDFLREKRASGVLLDTLLFNAHLPRVLARWRERLGSGFPEIVNCSPASLMQGIPIIDYPQAAAALAGEPVVVRAAKWPEMLPLPPARSAEDANPNLIACVNAGRSGDLVGARAEALRALCLAPGRLTPFAQRILQTDPRAIEAAYHLMTLTGGGLPGSAEYCRRVDFAREMRETKEAIGEAGNTWDNWE